MANYTLPQKTRAGLEQLLSTNPFYQAGLINLGDVRPYRFDPRLEGDVSQIEAQRRGLRGYTYPYDPAMYIGDIDKFNPPAAPYNKSLPQWKNEPIDEGLDKTWLEYDIERGDDPFTGLSQAELNAQIARTTGHEGIHNILDPTGAYPNMLDELSTGIGSALGPTGINFGVRYNTETGEYDVSARDTAGIAAKSERSELFTQWLQNQIYGMDIDVEEEDMLYANMLRPGQGKLGKAGIIKILREKGKPFLQKVALQAHRNIEARDAQKPKVPTSTYQGPPTTSGRDYQPQRPTRPGGFTDPGKGSYGPWKAYGGRIDKSLPGRSRDL